MGPQTPEQRREVHRQPRYGNPSRSKGRQHNAPPQRPSKNNRFTQADSTDTEHLGASEQKLKPRKTTEATEQVPKTRLCDIFRIDEGTELLTILEYARNIGDCLWDGPHAQIQCVLQDADFRRWLLDSKSRIIVIDNATALASYAITGSAALTHYVAAVLDWHGESSKSTSIGFFCGYNRNSVSGLIPDLIRSLSYQVLHDREMPEDFTYATMAGGAHLLANGKLSQTLQCFEFLLSIFVNRYDSLLCVIDCADGLDNDNRKAFQSVLQIFLRAVDRSNTMKHGPSFKLILTCQGKWNDDCMIVDNKRSLSEKVVRPNKLRVSGKGMSVSKEDLEMILRPRNKWNGL